MAIGCRATKIQELRDAIEDCVQRKRQIQSDVANLSATLERVARYRFEAAKLVAQANDAEANTLDWRARIKLENERLEKLRLELESVRKEDIAVTLSKAAKELANLDPETLKALAAERPELLLLLRLPVAEVTSNV